jgi:ferredoxin-like protein FixX
LKDNYGYEDGSGSYYLRKAKDQCGSCTAKGCLKSCPAGLFVQEQDDWDNEVVVLRADARNQLALLCSECKFLLNRSPPLPCQSACNFQAINHSW